MKASRVRNLLLGEFRISLLRTMFAQPRLRVLVAKGFSLRGAKRIRFDGPGYLHLGTEFFGFVDGHVRGLIRVRGSLILGGSVRVGRGCRWDIGPTSTIRVGDGTYFSPYVMLVSTHGISIGRNCAIGWGTEILDNDFHMLSRVGQSESSLETGSQVHIADHVWIGSGVKILKGVSVASGCIVAAGSLVTRSVEEEGCLIAGVPARVVKRGIKWD